MFYFFYPETSRIGLEEIDQIFLDPDRKPWHPVYVERQRHSISHGSEETAIEKGGDTEMLEKV